MKIFDVPMDDLKRIALETSVTFEGSDISNSRGYRVRGHLVPNRETPKENRPYRRLSASFFNPEREVFAVCWHGYRDFMRAVFTEYPNARIVSGLYGANDYRGLEGFEMSYRESGARMIGAPINGGYPRLIDACKCSEGDSDLAFG